MLEHALSMGEYSTFSKVMRVKATEVAKRRAWERAAAERRQRAQSIQVSFQWKNPDSPLKNPDLLFMNPDFLLKHVELII